jgi:peptide/nickel transport system permease protein
MITVTATSAASGSIPNLSQWQMVRRQFARHKLALVGLYLLGALYVVAVFGEFFAPYPAGWRSVDHSFCPPQPLRWSFSHGLHTYALVAQENPITLVRTYTEDRQRVVRLGLFTRGEPYRLWGLIPWDRHFLGVRAGKEAGGVVPPFYLLGADRVGHDLLSRAIYGARISLSVGLVAIGATFLLGVILGGISGYVGGWVDTVIQRVIEIINAFPHLPLWLGLAAALPQDWSPLRMYFGITILLSLLTWTGLARVVRGKLLALREEDYAVAARLLGASHGRIIVRHLLPGFSSHIIVSLTLAIPGMILGETALSFLGLGLRPPVVSWGVMLQDCMNIQVVASYPWLMLPSFLIILTVLSFNFLGDGLRDAADPYARR